MERSWRTAAGKLLVVTLAMLAVACGGGGEQGDGEPLPVVLYQPGPGDAERYFPLERGNEWQYDAAVTEEGATEVFRWRLASTQLRLVGDLVGTVFEQSDVDTGALLGESVLAGDQNGVAELGGALAGFGPVGPYWVLRFPLEPGSRFVQIDRKGLDLGEDLDGDGRSESANLRSVVTVLGVETLTVPAGTFARCAKVQTVADVAVTGSANRQTVSAKLFSTTWYAPGLGPVRFSEVLTVDGREAARTELELGGYLVNGAQGGDFWRGEKPWRVEVSRGEVDVSVGGTFQLAATAWSQMGQLDGLPVSWRSVDPAVATVSREGLVTGVAPGTTTLYATVNGMQSSQITVRVISGRALALVANDLVYDDSRGRIYASVPSSNGPTGNTIAVIDPATGRVEASLLAGSEPNQLALSTDGRYLYVSLDATGTISRFDLAAPGGPVKDRTFSAGIPYGMSTPYIVRDLAVMPGAPDTVAVSRATAGTAGFGFAGVAIFDAGVQRTNGNGFGGFITFGADPSRIYAFDPEGNLVSRLAVDSTGVTRLDGYRAAGSAFFDPEIDYAAGRVYLSTGAVVDAETGTALGLFALDSGYGLMAPDFANGRVFFLRQESNTYLWEVRAYDTATFVPVAVKPVSLGRANPRGLIRWGARGLAFRTESLVVFLDDVPGLP